MRASPSRPIYLIALCFAFRNHYTKMMELQDDLGKKVFETISITLVCDECLKSDRDCRASNTLHATPLLTYSVFLFQIPRNADISSRACRGGFRVKR